MNFKYDLSSPVLTFLRAKRLQVFNCYKPKLQLYINGCTLEAGTHLHIYPNNELHS